MNNGIIKMDQDKWLEMLNSKDLFLKTISLNALFLTNQYYYNKNKDFISIDGAKQYLQDAIGRLASKADVYGPELTCIIIYGIKDILKKF